MGEKLSDDDYQNSDISETGNFKSMELVFTKK